MPYAAEIRNLRPDIVGVFVTLACPQCSHSWEVYQPTVLGIAFGSDSCPKCSALLTVSPEQFESALDSFWAEPSREEMIKLTNEATRVTEDWHRAEPFASALTYRGVNLGEAAERFLVSHVTLGLRGAGEKEASR